MRVLALALALLPISAHGWDRRVLAAPSPVSLSLPFNRFGPYLEDDAGTVAHWIADCGPGKTFCDTKGNSWTMNGTVPRVTTSPLYPSGFGTGRRFVSTPGVGDSYFTAASDSYIANDFTMCIVGKPTLMSGSADPVITNQAAYVYTQPQGSAGAEYVVRWEGADVGHGNLWAGGGTLAPTVPGATNVFCFGRSGSTVYQKTNATTSHAATATYVTPVGVNQYLYGVNGSGIYEVWYTKTAWDDARVAAIQNAALNSGAPGGTKLFPDDQNTVLHVVGNDYTGGATWGPLTKVGTVAYSDAPVPPTDGYMQRTGYGSFSDANYLSLGAGSDSVDFSGDFTCRTVFADPGNDTARIFSNGDGTTGYEARRNGVSFGAASVNVSSPAYGAANILSWGRVGTTGYAKLNLGAAASGVVGTTAGTSVVAKIGRGTAGSQAAGTVHEVVCTSTPFSDTREADVHRRFFSMLGTKSEPVTVTRATTRTCEIGGKVWTVPANVACVNADGLSVEPAATNSALNSATHPKTNEASASLATGAYVAWHRGTGTLTLAAGTATVTGLSCSAVAALTLCPFTVTAPGTMLITTTAGTTHVQIEGGTVRTSDVITAGTAVTRNADQVSYTAPAGTVVEKSVLNGNAASRAATPGTMSIVQGKTRSLIDCKKDNARCK